MQTTVSRLKKVFEQFSQVAAVSPRRLELAYLSACFDQYKRNIFINTNKYIFLMYITYDIKVEKCNL